MSPALAREVLRRIRFSAKVLDSLATRRAADALAAAAPGGNAAAVARRDRGGAQRGRASRAPALLQGGATSASLAKVVYVHGHADDDVRACFVRLAVALLGCPADDVLRDVVRGAGRGIVWAVVRGLPEDVPTVALPAMAALGDAFLLSGDALPPRALAEVFNANALSVMLRGYARADAPQLRTALHSLLVPLTTGRLLLRDDSSDSRAPPADMFLDPASPRYAATAAAMGVPARVPCVFAAALPKERRDVHRQRNEHDSTDAHASPLAAASLRRDSALRTIIEIAGGSHGVANLAPNAGLHEPLPATAEIVDGQDDDVDASILRAQRRALDDDGMRAGRRGSRAAGTGGAGAAAAAALGATLGLVPAAAAALQFLVAVRSPEDPLQADLVLRVLRALPQLAQHYARLFPCALEPRPSARWAASASMLCHAIELPVADALSSMTPRPTVELTITVREAATARDSQAIATPRRGSHRAIALSATQSTAGDVASVRRVVGVSDTVIIGVNSVDCGDGGTVLRDTVCGVPASLIVRSIVVPATLPRALLTRGLLHVHPVVVLHTLRLVRAIITRAAAVSRWSMDDHACLRSQECHTGSSTSRAVTLARHNAIVAALGLARRARAEALAAALTPILPDVQTLQAVRARAIALIAGTPPTTDASQRSYHLDLYDADDAAAVTALTLLTNKANMTGGSAAAIDRRATGVQLGSVLLEEMCDVLRIAAGVLPETSSADGGASFDYLRLLGDAINPSVSDGAVASILRLLLVLPLPAVVDVVARWLGAVRGGSTAVAHAPVASRSAVTVVELEADLDAAANVAAMSPFTCTLRLAACSSSRDVSSLAVALTREVLLVLPDASAPSSDHASAVRNDADVMGSTVAEQALHDESVSSRAKLFGSSALCWRSDASLPAHSQHGVQIRGVAVSSEVDAWLRVTNALCAAARIQSGAYASAPQDADMATCRALLSTFAEGRSPLRAVPVASAAGTLTSGTLPAADMTNELHLPLPCAIFAGLVWAGAHDATPSPYDARVTLFVGGRACSDAVSAAPFTVRAWLAYVSAVAERAADIVDEVSPHATFTAASAALSRDVNVFIHSGRPVIGNEGDAALSSGASVASATTRSVAAAQQAPRLAACLLSATGTSLLIGVTLRILSLLPQQQAGALRETVSALLRPAIAVMSADAANGSRSSGSAAAAALLANLISTPADGIDRSPSFSVPVAIRSARKRQLPTSRIPESDASAHAATALVAEVRRISASDAATRGSTANLLACALLSQRSGVAMAAMTDAVVLCSRLNSSDSVVQEWWPLVALADAADANASVSNIFSASAVADAVRIPKSALGPLTTPPQSIGTTAAAAVRLAKRVRSAEPALPQSGDAGPTEGDISARDIGVAGMLTAMPPELLFRHATAAICTGAAGVVTPPFAVSARLRRALMASLYTHVAVVAAVRDPSCGMVSLQSSVEEHMMPIALIEVPGGPNVQPSERLAFSHTGDVLASCAAAVTLAIVRGIGEVPTLWRDPVAVVEGVELIGSMIALAHGGGVKVSERVAALMKPYSGSHLSSARHKAEGWLQRALQNAELQTHTARSSRRLALPLVLLPLLSQGKVRAAFTAACVAAVENHEDALSSDSAKLCRGVAKAIADVATGLLEGAPSTSRLVETRDDGTSSDEIAQGAAIFHDAVEPYVSATLGAFSDSTRSASMAAAADAAIALLPVFTTEQRRTLLFSVAASAAAGGDAALVGSQESVSSVVMLLSQLLSTSEASVVKIAARSATFVTDVLGAVAALCRQQMGDTDAVRRTKRAHKVTVLLVAAARLVAVAPAGMCDDAGDAAAQLRAAVSGAVSELVRVAGADAEARVASAAADLAGALVSAGSGPARAALAAACEPSKADQLQLVAGTISVKRKRGSAREDALPPRNICDSLALAADSDAGERLASAKFVAALLPALAAFANGEVVSGDDAEVALAAALRLPAVLGLFVDIALAKDTRCDTAIAAASCLSTAFSVANGSVPAAVVAHSCVIAVNRSLTASGQLALSAVTFRIVEVGVRAALVALAAQELGVSQTSPARADTSAAASLDLLANATKFVLATAASFTVNAVAASDMPFAARTTALAAELLAWHDVRRSAGAAPSVASLKRNKRDESAAGEASLVLRRAVITFIEAALAAAPAATAPSVAAVSGGTAEAAGGTPKSGGVSLLSLPGMAVVLEHALTLAAASGWVTPSAADQPSTSLSLHTVHAMLVSHPWFLHLLLRDRFHYRHNYTAPAADARAVIGSPHDLWLSAVAAVTNALPHDSAITALGAVLPSNIQALRGAALRDATAAPFIGDSARLASARLLLLLTTLDGSAAHSAPSSTAPPASTKSGTTPGFMLPLIAAAYTASLSPADRCLRALLAAYEARGLHPSSIGYAWSTAALRLVDWSHSGLSRAPRATQAPAAGAPAAAAPPPSRLSYDWVLASGGGAAAGTAAPSTRRGGTFSRSAGRSGASAGRGAGVGQREHTGGGTGPEAAAVSSAIASAPAWARCFYAPVNGLAGAQLGLLPRRATATVAAFPCHRGISRPEHSSNAPSRELPRCCGPLPPLRFSDADAECAVEVDAAGAPSGLPGRSVLGHGAQLAFAPGVRSTASATADGSSARIARRVAARSAVYDPSWVMPALTAVLLSGLSQARRFVSSGALGIALASLTSGHESVRRAGYAIVGAYYELLGGGGPDSGADGAAAAAALAVAAARGATRRSAAAGTRGGGAARGRSAGGAAAPAVGAGGDAAAALAAAPAAIFRESPQLLLLLALLRASVTVPFQRLHCLAATFFAEAATTQLQPSSPAYALVNRLLLRTTRLDLNDAPPLTYACLSSGSAAQRAWMLRLLRCGAQGSEDHAALRRRHVYHLALSVAGAALPTASVIEVTSSPQAIVVLRGVMALLLSAARVLVPLHRRADDARPRRALADDADDAASTSSSTSVASHADALDDLVSSTSSSDESTSSDSDGSDASSVVAAGAAAPVSHALTDAARRALARADSTAAGSGGASASDGPAGSQPYAVVATSGSDYSNSSFQLGYGVAAYLRRGCGTLEWASALWSRAAGSLLTPYAASCDADSDNCSPMGEVRPLAVSEHGDDKLPHDANSVATCYCAPGGVPLDVLASAAELCEIIGNAAVAIAEDALARGADSLRETPLWAADAAEVGSVLAGVARDAAVVAMAASAGGHPRLATAIVASCIQPLAATAMGAWGIIARTAETDGADTPLASDARDAARALAALVSGVSATVGAQA